METKAYYLFCVQTGSIRNFGNNFVTTMPKLGKKYNQPTMVADQIGIPTCVVNLANCTLQIIQSANQSYGIIHSSNKVIALWHNFVKVIFHVKNNLVKVLPIKSIEHIIKAKRLSFSIMDKSENQYTIYLEIPHWHDSLKGCLSQIKNN